MVYKLKNAINKNIIKPIILDVLKLLLLTSSPVAGLYFLGGIKNIIMIIKYPNRAIYVGVNSFISFILIYIKNYIKIELKFIYKIIIINNYYK